MGKNQNKNYQDLTDAWVKAYPEKKGMNTDVD